MDARLDPAKVLGLEEGDAHVIRNAGGRTVDGLRSLVISQQLLGTREIVIIHHVCISSFSLELSRESSKGMNAVLTDIVDRLRHAHFHGHGDQI